MTPPRRGLALVELLLAVLVLAIVFGLIVNLARRVRREASHQLATRVLVELEAGLRLYTREHDTPPPGVPPLLPPGAGDAEVNPNVEAVWRLEERAERNNRTVVRALAFGTGVVGEGSVIDTLGEALFDGGVLRDPWGQPFAYMPAGSPLVGTAAGDRPFFFSAGPDGLYLTRGDNLYSYELVAATWTPAEPEADGPALDSP